MTYLCWILNVILMLWASQQNSIYLRHIGVVQEISEADISKPGEMKPLSICMAICHQRLAEYIYIFFLSNVGELIL